MERTSALTTSESTGAQGFTVVIAGGGFAAAEALLRLRRLAADHVTVTLLTPNDDLIYRPLTLLVPFASRQADRYPIQRLATDTGARWVQDSVAWVDVGQRTVHTAGGQQLPYEALLLAVGARERKPLPHVSIFTDRTSGKTYRRIVADLHAGLITSLVLIEPAGPSWPLPLYELALLTAKHAHTRGLRLDITVVTPEARPLYAFGETIGETVEGLLSAAGVTLHTQSRARVSGPRHVRLEPGGLDLLADRIVTLPTIMGPNVRGVPGGAIDRFIPVDERCRVIGTDGRVFAAGDATALPVKHGSLAAQQGDTAAAGIAHLAGAGPAPTAFRPVLNGTLLTGDEPLYLTAHLVAGTSWTGQIHAQRPWRSKQIVVAEELGPYLDNLRPGNSP
jgi:sulfide:quinone oxidoreductase